MPYCKRNQLNEIDGVFARRQPGIAEEFLADDDPEIKEFRDDPTTLKGARKAKIEELKAEAMTRIQTVLPGITDYDQLDLVREQWLSIAPAARSATTDFQFVIDCVQAARTARQDILALGTVIEVNAYDIVNTPSWP